ncbi:hypothetical protein KIW84_012962 [Lathyrus oleraceus]|uniref:Uncharacterized protein n=1 Tax=Pisum sativum TaxID=3888 RepID=A0A9D5GX27_PEA|nr:hypothetical protein KIW84_012962 [Pisum sativum]
MKIVVDIYVEHKGDYVVNDGDDVVNVEDGVSVEDDGGVNNEGVVNAEEDEHEDSDFNDESDDSDFEANGSSNVNEEMEINYGSDELGSSDPDVVNQESGPRYPGFKMDELDKSYKFKVRLDFVSLDGFKEAIFEWVLNNSSTNYKWISKTVVTRMAFSDGIKIHDIVSDIRSNYSVGITMNKAWKVKQIAKALVEGDASK